MITTFDQFGLDKKEIKNTIERYFKENADILMGIDDPEVNQLIDILVDAFIETIDKNNKEFSNNIKQYIKECNEEKQRGW